jgi:hypothetical protein
VCCTGSSKIIGIIHFFIDGCLNPKLVDRLLKSHIKKCDALIEAVRGKKKNVSEKIFHDQLWIRIAIQVVLPNEFVLV